MWSACYYGNELKLLYAMSQCLSHVAGLSSCSHCPLSAGILPRFRHSNIWAVWHVWVNWTTDTLPLPYVGRSSSNLFCNIRILFLWPVLILNLSCPNTTSNLTYYLHTYSSSNITCDVCLSMFYLSMFYLWPNLSVFYCTCNLTCTILADTDLPL